MIQPSHPIFGDINAKYMGGVVENKGTLYIILDVVHIFSQNQEENPQPRSAIAEKAPDAYYEAPASSETGDAAMTAENLGFIKEGLTALKKFYSGPVNEAWLVKRFGEWNSTHTGENIQLGNSSDADIFLETFYSPCNGKFWTSEYAYAVKAALPDLSSNNIQVWNAGCSKGYETFSLACILKLRYPLGHIKIWANDNDIMAISNAPNLLFEMNEVPDYCQSFLTKGRTGYGFNSSIKDSIVFEYHDITNVNTLPDIDIVLCRDTLSFLPPEGQATVLADISGKLKKRGIVILGKNELMPGGDWIHVGKDPVPAFALTEQKTENQN
jgi:purine-binding chemotaxis protein CheW